MIDFGIADYIEAKAIGEPGQRTFHLRFLGDAGQSATLKLEKEHLVGLHTGVTTILADEGSEDVSEASMGVGDFPQNADHEFSVGRVGMGFDKEPKMVVLQAEELQTADGQDLRAIRVRFTLAQGVTLVGQLEEIIGTGRPVCPLCGAPIDQGGHTCIRSNGHSRQSVPEPPDAEEP
jgi:uncharacterized repeat protein (TIGR03847 family)